MPASAPEILRVAGVTAQVDDVRALGAVLRIASADNVAALGALAAEGYDQLVDLFGVDTGEALEVTYHVRVLAEMRDAYVRVSLPYDGTLRSVWHVYPAALYAERETAELYGLVLDGHPNPKRLLTTDGVEPLLRKSVPVRNAEEVRYS